MAGCSLAIRMGRWCARAGAGVGLVGRQGAIMAETWLPNEPRSASVRTDTGTMARSGSAGSSSWSMSQRRSAPAQMAMTTSFTVTPAAFFTAFTSSSDSVANTQRGGR